MARLHKPDVIVCDMRLPGMSGLEVMGLLEGNATTRGIPVIMTTAKKLSADEHRSLESRGVTRPAEGVAGARGRRRRAEADDRAVGSSA